MENSYDSVIGKRYKAPHLSPLWSTHSKISKMRDLWITLAMYQKEIGVDIITDEMINEMNEEKNNINLQKIDEYEKRFHHDIMAHIHTFGDLCPNARKIIHLGATSNFINDNVDLILIQKSLQFILLKEKELFTLMKEKSFEYKEIPTFAYTHLQQAQLITIGKRFTMWNQDLYMDILFLQESLQKIAFRGIKGTVGSEDTLLKLFDGDHSKVILLNEKLSKHYGFEKSLIICGQTYSRKIDVMIFQILSNLCQTIYKMMNDIRLLASKEEIQESFGKEQIGSSAMPYKKNPITCEKICSLCRYVIQQQSTIEQTYINQWLERSLDDSAIKRIIYPEVFLLTESILHDSIKLISTLYVNTQNIENSIFIKMPNIISEEIMIQGVKLGLDRQEIHERIRRILTDSSILYPLKELQKDELLSTIFKSSQISISPTHYTGRCIQQIESFYQNVNLNS